MSGSLLNNSASSFPQPTLKSWTFLRDKGILKKLRRGRVVVPDPSLKDANRAWLVHQLLFYISDIRSESSELDRGLVKFCLKTPCFPRSCQMWQIPPKTELPTGQHSHFQSSSASAPQGIFFLYEFLQQVLSNCKCGLALMPNWAISCQGNCKCHSYQGMFLRDPFGAQHMHVLNRFQMDEWMKLFGREGELN